MFVFTHVCSHLYRFILPCTHWFSLKVMCSFLLVRVTCFILAHLRSFSFVCIHFQLYRFIFPRMHSFSCVRIRFHVYAFVFMCTHSFSCVRVCFHSYVFVLTCTGSFTVGHSSFRTRFQLDALILSLRIHSQWYTLVFSWTHSFLVGHTRSWLYTLVLACMHLFSPVCTRPRPHTHTP